MHADGKSTLASVSKWNSVKVNCFVRIFHFTIGQLAYCSERAKEANLKELDGDNYMVSIQSSDGYLLHSVFHY